MKAWITYDFPLRGTTAQCVLPCDLKQSEANRLCAMIRALVVDWQNPQSSDDQLRPRLTD